MHTPSLVSIGAMQRPSIPMPRYSRAVSVLKSERSVSNYIVTTDEAIQEKQIKTMKEKSEIGMKELTLFLARCETNRPRLLPSVLHRS